MLKIKLVRMGMDFDEKMKSKSDMQNYRLRPRLWDPGLNATTEYLRDRDGAYIAGDFSYLQPNPTQPPRLGLDFTAYNASLNNAQSYTRADKYAGLPPTLASIKSWLEEMLGEEVELMVE